MSTNHQTHTDLISNDKTLMRSVPLFDTIVASIENHVDINFSFLAYDFKNRQITPCVGG